MVSGVERAGFFGFEREIAEAGRNAFFLGARPSDRGPRRGIALESEFDGGQGISGFEGADFG
jgi:hypothetical protein